VNSDAATAAAAADTTLVSAEAALMMKPDSQSSGSQQRSTSYAASRQSNFPMTSQTAAQLPALGITLPVSPDALAVPQTPPQPSTTHIVSSSLGLVKLLSAGWQHCPTLLPCSIMEIRKVSA